MNETLIFLLFALLITVSTLGLLLPSLWRGRRSLKQVAERKIANLTIFRDQQADLAREKSEGLLSDADFDEAQQELQKRLLHEVKDDSTPLQEGGARKTAMLLGVLLPIFAFFAWGAIGNADALNESRRLPAPVVDSHQVLEMVEKLAAKQKANPENLEGWVMLARSYRMMDRHADAVEAFSHAETLIDKSPDALSGYAESLAMTSDKGLTGKPQALINRALALNPKHAHSLFLAGLAALEADKTAEGIAYWETLLAESDTAPELKKILKDGIADAKAREAKKSTKK